jgi:hypothetical protein
VPPGVNGTTMRTVLAGYCCAVAGMDVASHPAHSNTNDEQ